MVKSNNGRSVHDETQGYEDADLVDDVGLDSGGFNYDPKQVPGTENVSVDRSGYGTRERDWETQGEFQMGNQQALDVFSEIMDGSVQDLDEPEDYTDGGQPMEEVEHEGPYGEFDEGGAPW